MLVIPQRTEWDCGVASVAMLLGIPYNDVRDAVYKIIDDPKLKKRGLILKQVEQILKHYGFKSKKVHKKEGYLEGATGILGLLGGCCDPAGHWVVLKDGMIIDPSGGEAHEVDDYMKEGKCRPATLLVLA